MMNHVMIHSATTRYFMINKTETTQNSSRVNKLLNASHSTVLSRIFSSVWFRQQMIQRQASRPPDHGKL